MGNGAKQGQVHYWITTVVEGRTVLIYGGATEDEANKRGWEKLDTPFEVVPLRTVNQAAASQMLKGQKLEVSADLKASMERLRHKV